MQTIFAQHFFFLLKFYINEVNDAWLEASQVQQFNQFIPIIELHLKFFSKLLLRQLRAKFEFTSFILFAIILTRTKKETNVECKNEIFVFLFEIDAVCI